MKNNEHPTPHRVLARRVLGAVVIVALIVSAYIAWQTLSPASTPTAGTHTLNTSTPAASDAEAPDDAEAAATDPPDPTAEPGAGGPLPAEQADAAVQKFLDASVAVDPAAANSTDGLTTAAAGAILDEAQNDAQELEVNGWRREGAATVEAVTIVNSDSATDPGTVVAQACVDSSSVRTLDADGKPLSAPGDTAQRALNLFTLQYISGTWKVVARSFPDEFAC